MVLSCAIQKQDFVEDMSSLWLIDYLKTGFIEYIKWHIHDDGSVEKYHLTSFLIRGQTGFLQSILPIAA